MFNHLCEFEEHVKKYLKDNLQLNHKESSSYTGGLDGGDMYTTYNVVELVLDGEVISEISFSTKG